MAKEVGLEKSSNAFTGNDLETLSDAQLDKAVEEVQVFARTTPEEKLRLVKALHRDGEVVAVTGDGINDAAALRAADIGIAMGMRGQRRGT